MVAKGLVTRSLNSYKPYDVWRHPMKRLLLVDDDALAIRLYRDRLSVHGFQVNTAASGSAAITFLQAAKPDLVVLDLMMPDLSGVEVLKFIRSQPRLAPLPVIVLTNAYLNDLGREAATIGIEKAFLKGQCSPSVLMASIDEIFRTKQEPGEPAQKSESATTSATASATVSPVQPQPAPKPGGTGTGPAPHPPSSQRSPESHSVPAGVPPTSRSAPEPPVEKSSIDSLAEVPAICAELRKLFQGLARSPRKGPEELTRLKDLFRKVHVLSAGGGRTEFTALTQTATVFEALLFVLINDPSRINASVLRTLASLVDFTEFLSRNADESRRGVALSTQVLVVDDDPVSNLMVVTALKQAHLNPRSTEDPVVAWQWAHNEHFDLILLDIEMPAPNGFEFCERLRVVPGYEQTPVIFVTIHDEFESRAKSSLSGADDLISKPILPMELAAKVVMHLIKSQMPA